MLEELYKTTDEVIRAAIMSRNIIEFSYHNHDRVAEPHVYGTHNGRKQLLTYLIGGQSSSGSIPGWRRVNVDEITSIRITPQTFLGQRPYPSDQHGSGFDEVLAVVSYRDEVAE